MAIVAQPATDDMVAKFMAAQDRNDRRAAKKQVALKDFSEISEAMLDIDDTPFEDSEQEDLREDETAPEHSSNIDKYQGWVPGKLLGEDGSEDADSAAASCSRAQANPFNLRQSLNSMPS